MQSVSPIHFPDKFRIRGPNGMRAAIELAAKQRHTTMSEWARQALLRGLEADGVRLAAADLQAGAENKTAFRK